MYTTLANSGLALVSDMLTTLRYTILGVVYLFISLGLTIAIAYIVSTSFLLSKDLDTEPRLESRARATSRIGNNANL